MTAADSDAEVPTSTATEATATEATAATPLLPHDRDWLKKLLKNPNARRNDRALVVAPMVDQSELPYRLLCRKYGANLCFTPMIHAKLLCTVDSYRNKFIGTWLPQQDRPLIAQLAGSDVSLLLQAARYVEPHVDGIDINCGCPQNIAKRGNYGAFLLEQETLLVDVVRQLSPQLRVPLSVKVRLLPEPEHWKERNPTTPWDVAQRSLGLYTKLVDAGARMLTIHGRTRHQKSLLTGHADWRIIRRAVDLLGHRIPILANGSIATYDDIEACLEQTQADGIMSSEAVLEYPPLFYKQTPQRTIGRVQLAQEYLDFVRQYPPHIGGQGSGMKCVRTHLHRFLHADLQQDPYWRSRVVNIDTVDGLQECVDYFVDKHKRMGHRIETEELSWYMRHRADPDLVRERLERNCQIKYHELDDDAAECMGNMFEEPLNECGRTDAGDY